MEHLDFFELPADPFQNDADARFYYESAPQKRARLRLLRGIHQRKALSVLVGGPGLGKTTLAHVLLRTLEQKDYAVHYLSIPHESCSSGWFLPNVARAFGVPMPSEQVPRLVEQIHSQLVAITIAKRNPVLLIDEAQLFRNRDAMEEFRGLLNLTHDGKKLISLVLFGLHELSEILKLDAPLAQRVEVRVEMSPMDWLESQAYVSHRLRLAGAAQAVFSPDALESLFRWSGGVPRVLNTLADNSLFEAFLTETKPVDSTIVQTAAQALGLFRVPSDSVVSAINVPPIAPPAPDLLAVTEVTPEPKAARLARRDTMPAAKPSPALRAPQPEPDLDAIEPTALEVEAPELAAEPEDSAPEWLEPLSPMPDDVPAQVRKPTPESVALELDAPVDAELDLEEVIPEDTGPVTPARTRVTFKELDTAPAAEEEDDDEVALGADEDEADLSLGSLLRESDSTAEEEAVLAELGPAEPAPEELDLAPVRRTPPLAKPAVAARPMTPPRAAPAVTPPKAAPVRPAAVAAKPTPARPSPAKGTPARPSPAIPANNEDSFDLRNLVAEEDTAPSGVLTPPAKDDDDDLDALFDEIQIGDK